jgi:putative ABC transport system ATP-binding protein
MISLSAIERIFQVGDQQVHALRDINLEIGAGEYLSIMGPSGSGKSTLLNLLGLLDRPTAGIYRFEGHDVTALSDSAQAQVRRNRIGFVFQFFHLVPRLSALENVELPMMLGGVAAPERRSRARDLLESYGLADRAHLAPTSSPAASANGWRSPAPPSCTRRCCSPTNPPATSTAHPARTWSRSSSICTTRG